jgi:hypothetical protein
LIAIFGTSGGAASRGKRRTCWVAWEDMTKPKCMGGLGFRDIELFNLALLESKPGEFYKSQLL